MKRLQILAAVAVLAIATHHTAQANDAFKVATAQRGFWDTTVLLYGDRQGFFKDAGLAKSTKVGRPLVCENCCDPAPPASDQSEAWG